MTDFSAELFGSPSPDTGDIASAIHQQESGGAEHDYQIQPETFKQYAQAGESYDNPADHDAVYGRILDDLHQKSGGDPARMAVGYFSGPGNISPPDSATPYKNDVKDKNGKSVSSYVSDVVGRLNPVSDAKAAQGKDFSAELFGDEKPQSLVDALKYQTDPVRSAYQGSMNTVAKPINEAINSVVSPVMGAVASAEEKPAQGIANAIDSAVPQIGDTLLKAKDAVSDVGANIKDLESYNPNLEKDLGAFGQNAQLAANLAPLKPAAEAVGAGLGQTGKIISGAGEAQSMARKANFVQDLVTPKITPSVAADQFSRSTEQGLLRSRVVEPTAQEQGIIDTVSQLPVSKNKSMLANYNTIAEANTKEATDLIAKLKANDVPIGLDDAQNMINNSMKELKANPYVTGNGEQAALKVVNVMNKAILDNTAEDGTLTASGLLQARKDFDAMIKAQKGGKMFDPVLDSPTSIAVQNMRQGVNNLIESKMPDAGFKESLRKQSNLYRAMDNIETKGGLEPSNMVKRAIDKTADMIPGKHLLTKGAVLATGATGAAMAPIAAGASLAGYTGYKALTSPITKKIIGGTLQGAGKVLGHKEGGIIKNREAHLSKKLETKLGRKPKDREIELAEHVGANGVHRLLNQKDVSMPAHKMFPQEAVKQKRELFFNGRKPYTVEHIQKALG